VSSQNVPSVGFSGGVGPWWMASCLASQIGSLWKYRLCRWLKACWMRLKFSCRRGISDGLKSLKGKMS